MLKKDVALAIMATILGGCTWSYPAFAETEEPVPSANTKTVTINSNNRAMATATFYGAGDGFAVCSDSKVSSHDLDPKLEKGVIKGITYWSDMLAAKAKNKQPLEVLVVTNTEEGASAASVALGYNEEKDDIDEIDVVAPARQVILGNVNTVTYEELTKTHEGTAVISFIEVGQNMGTNEDETCSDGFTPSSTSMLAQNGKASDLPSVIRHEMAHALGISTEVDSLDADGNPIEEDDDDTLAAAHIFSAGNFEDNKKSFASHLVDVNGTKAEAEMQITKSLGEDGFLIDSNNYAYFQGDKVADVLEGADNNLVKVLGYEGDAPELSHLELKNNLMSHQTFRNYTTFIEAELAVMQDMGYEFDRRNYFGRSVYGDNQTLTNTNGYFARNEAGTDYLANTYNTTDYGIGLHVYGSNNDITQAANIMTKGYGAIGIRVDGEGNTIRVAQDTKINADGENNIGVLVAYGKNQQVDIDGLVTAKGTKGNALQLDFGSNILGQGTSSEYRGSYIRYFCNNEGISYNMDVTKDATAYLDDGYEPIGLYEANELNGALVNSLNISGTVEGNTNAIYIGKGAFVQSINLLEGAQLKGDITSDWKHLKDVVIADLDNIENEELVIQYKGDFCAYNQYIPDLVTNLNIMGDVSYDSAINGKDNMKLNVKKGTFSFDGQAELVGVTVEKDAQLLGGSYSLKDMTGYMATGYDDATTGKLINKGTIGAALPVVESTAMIIDGNLVLAENSNIQFTAKDALTGVIEVEGSVEQEGSVNLVVDSRGQYLPGSYSVLKANGEDYALALNETESLYKTSLLTASYDEAGSKIVFAVEDNLGNLTKQEEESLEAVANISAQNDSQELKSILNADAATAKKVLKGLSNSGTASFAGLSQHSTYAQKLVAKRLNGLNWGTREVKVKVVPKALVEAQQKPLAVDMKLQLPAEAENGLWVSVDKVWGEAAGGNSHSSGMALGYDKQYNDHNRAGLFFGYERTSFSNDSASDKLQDYRLGFYNGYSKGNAQLQTFVDFGSERHKTQRSAALLGTTKANYRGKLAELGAEYKYTLLHTAEKSFQVAPYVNGRLSRYWQKSYQEQGHGLFDKAVRGYSSSYAATELGLEISRKLPKGSYGFRAGYKEVWTGNDPTLTFNYAGDSKHSYRNNAKFDKHFVTASLKGSMKLNHKWSLEGNAGLVKGAHDKDGNASLTLKYQW